MNKMILGSLSILFILIASILVAYVVYPSLFIVWVSTILPVILVISSLGLVWFLMGGSGSFRVTYAFMKRGFQAFISYKFQVVFTIVSMVLMVLLYYVVGKPFVDLMITSMSGALLNYGGYDFLSFILVGLIAWPMLLSGYMIASTRIRQEQYSGMFEIMIPSRYTVKVLPFASLIMGVTGSLISSVSSLIVFIFVLGVKINASSPAAVIGLVAVVILSLLTMWGLGLILGGLTITYKQIGPVSTILQTLMMFFCGVYIPIQILPGWIQPLSYALPLTYSFNAIRAGLIGGQGILDYWQYLVPLLIFFIIMVVGGYIVFIKLLNKARKDGTTYGY